MDSRMNVENGHQAILYGTHFPNRIFVGCLSSEITAAKLGEFFMKFATVVEAKIILDEHLQSKRFGFVTLACKEDVDNILSRKKFFIKGKRINVGPAIKKQHPSAVTSNTEPVKIVRPKILNQQKMLYVYEDAVPADTVEYSQPPSPTQLVSPMMTFPTAAHSPFPMFTSPPASPQYSPVAYPPPPGFVEQNQYLMYYSNPYFMF